MPGKWGGARRARPPPLDPPMLTAIPYILYMFVNITSRNSIVRTNKHEICTTAFGDHFYFTSFYRGDCCPTPPPPTRYWLYRRLYISDLYTGHRCVSHCFFERIRITPSRNQGYPRMTYITILYKRKFCESTSIRCVI